MWSEKDRPVGIISNNSKAAVETYIDAHDIRPLVTEVSARMSFNPMLLKPNPYLLYKALGAVGVKAYRAVFVGDSPTDIVAASAAGITPIGYANKPGKFDELLSAGAPLIVDSLARLQLAV
jgi:HAD superfamily hydrolase (TIGR01509 family)